MITTLPFWQTSSTPRCRIRMLYRPGSTNPVRQFLGLPDCVILFSLHRQSQIDAYMHSETPVVGRGFLVEGFKAGSYSVLVDFCSSSLLLIAGAKLTSSNNSVILTGGADIPNIDCVIVARRHDRGMSRLRRFVRVRSSVSKLAPIDLVRRLDAG